MCVSLSTASAKTGFCGPQRTWIFFFIFFSLHIWKDVTMYFAYAIRMPKKLVRLSSSKAWNDDSGV